MRSIGLVALAAIGCGRVGPNRSGQPDSLFSLQTLLAPATHLAPMVSPAVVLVHGGPSDERAQIGFGPFVHWLANRGYAVLYLNYRGSPGFGKRFVNAQNHEWGGRMHRDLLEQIDWAIVQKWFGPTRSRSWVAATAATRHSSG